MQNLQIESDLDPRLQNILIECWYTDGRIPRSKFISDVDQDKIRNSPECAEFVYQIIMKDKDRSSKKRLQWLQSYYNGYHDNAYLPRFARRMCLELQTTTTLFERAINDTIKELKKA